MDGLSERNSPKDAANNTEMLFALLTQSEELRKGIVRPGHYARDGLFAWFSLVRGRWFVSF